jgi:hypothetical protein
MIACSWVVDAVCAISASAFARTAASSLCLVDPAKHAADDGSEHHFPHVHDGDRRARGAGEFLGYR